MGMTLDQINTLSILKTSFKGTPVGLKALSGMTHIPERAVKRIIQELRLLGYPVSGGEDGYYYATSPHDLDEAINIIKSHIRTRQETIQALEKTKIVMTMDRQQGDMFK